VSLKVCFLSKLVAPGRYDGIDLYYQIPTCLRNTIVPDRPQPAISFRELLAQAYANMSYRLYVA